MIEIQVSLRRWECGCLHGGVIENGCSRNPLTLCSVPVLVHVHVWVHILGDPQSVQLRKATTTTKSRSSGCTQLPATDPSVYYPSGCNDVWQALDTEGTSAAANNATTSTGHSTRRVEHSEGHPIYAPTPVHVRVQVHCIGREERVCDRFQLTRHVGSRTPSSEGFISLSGEWGLLCQELTMAEGDPHTKRHNNFLP